MKKKKEREEKKHETSPVRHLQLELRKLRRELRTTARVYTQRLEHELIAATDALGRYAPAEKLTRTAPSCPRFRHHGAATAAAT